MYRQITAACAGLILVGTAAPVAGQVTGACHVSPIVANLDRSLGFYRDLLGLEVSPLSSPLPWDENRTLRELHGLPDVRLRYFTARVPGSRCGIEPVEFAARDRSPATLRMQDAGAVTLILLVRDIDAAFAKLAAAGVPVVTTGGAPVLPSPRSKTRAVIVRDPDGHFVELAQLDPLPATTASATSNVFDIRFRVTVADIEQSIRYYHDHLGIAAKASPFARDPGVMAMMGMPETAEYRVSLTPIPGSTLILEFLELKGPERGAVRTRVQDPGSYRLQLTVKDVTETVAALSRAGSRPLAKSGAPIQLTLGRPWLLAVLPDLHNIFLVLQQGPLP